MRLNNKVMDYNLDSFKRGLERLNITLSEEQINQFLKFYEMLIEKNKVMNLTAITEFEDVVEKHFLDSLSLILSVNLNKPLTIIDIGTGAGFPGIPLKIAFPELQILLVDSLNKRIVFLKEVIDLLALKKCKVLHARAEDLAVQAGYREKFDICVSRAVANLSTLSEYCIPFVKVGGQFISYKSGECEDEVINAKKAIFLLGGRKKDIFKFSLGENSRSLILLEKINHTPKKYPRNAGLPKKNPL